MLGNVAGQLEGKKGRSLVDFLYKNKLQMKKFKGKIMDISLHIYYIYTHIYTSTNRNYGYSFNVPCKNVQKL